MIDAVLEPEGDCISLDEEGSRAEAATVVMDYVGPVTQVLTSVWWSRSGSQRSPNIQTAQFLTPCRPISL